MMGFFNAITGLQVRRCNRGIVVGNDTDNVIGRNLSALERNVIRENNTGIQINTVDNDVLGNYIGTDASGSADLGNITGIDLLASGNRIGGTGALDGNLISGNDVVGISIPVGSGNQIAGNYIGTNAAGTAALPNTTGITVTTAASNNTIGGSTAATRNIISGNTTGVRIVAGGTTGNVVLGNYIGVNAAGAAALPNSPACL
jgi:titin